MSATSPDRFRRHAGDRDAAGNGSRSRWSSWAQAALACLLTLAVAVGANAQSTVVPPLSLPGPYPVACSNVQQDFSRMLPGEDVQAYWEGLPRDNGTPRSIRDLLADPADTLSVTVTAPDDDEVYGSYAGRTLSFAVVVCYPTSTANARPDYLLPTGRTVSHMQTGAQPPLWPDATTRFPLLLFSHGYGGSPLSNDYINAVKVLASFGYVVAAPFHADWQYTSLDLANFGDAIQLILHLRDFLAMQAIRPLALAATIDLLQASPVWRDRVDFTRVGGFGASLGAESMMLLGGARLTTSLGLSSTQVIRDTRLKAITTYVPYFGQVIFPAFGRDQEGIVPVTVPVLGIAGTEDTTAPLPVVYQAMSRLQGTRELVALRGVRHGFDVASTNDIFTWTLTFLDAELNGNAQSKQRIASMSSVAGGGDDFVLIPYNGSTSTPVASNYGGIWWNAPTGSESGWAINLAHQGDVLFATWVTYDAAGRPLWLSMTATPIAANVYTGTLYRTTGPPFNSTPWDASRVTLAAVGTGTLSFADPNSATFAYTLNGVTQTKVIQRGVFASPVPTCTFGALSNLALATNYQDIWANAPLGSEPGWALNLAQQDNIIFAIWLTYDVDGAPLWLTATLVNVGGAAYAGTLYRTAGPPFNALPWNPAAVTLVPVGMTSIAFVNGNSATFTYTLNGITQTKSITRNVLRAPGTVCQ